MIFAPSGIKAITGWNSASVCRHFCYLKYLSIVLQLQEYNTDKR